VECDWGIRGERVFREDVVEGGEDRRRGVSREVEGAEAAVYCRQF